MPIMDIWDNVLECFLERNMGKKKLSSGICNGYHVSSNLVAIFYIYRSTAAAAGRCCS